MIQLTFVYILYSLQFVCLYKKHTKVVSVSQLYRFCIVCTLFVCIKNIQSIVRTPLIISHPLNFGGRTFQKLSHLGVPKSLLESGDNSEKGGIVVEMGCATFFITLQFNCIQCVCVCVCVCVGGGGEGGGAGSKVCFITF